MTTILGKCFRTCSSSTNPRISHLTIKNECPQLSFFNHYIWHTNQQSRPRVLSYCSVLVFSPQAHACNTLIKFLKVKVPNTAPHNEVQIHFLEKMTRAIQMLTRKGGPTVLGRNPITSYLTAQLQHTLLALEFPRLLAPDLPSN